MDALTQLPPIDYLVIGHIACDLAPDIQAGEMKMGGTASYAALTAQALGLRVGVITSWGREIPLGGMANIPIINKPTQHSTTFENIYTPEGRTQILHHLAEPLDGQLIPAAWRQTRIVHIGPIAAEVDPQVIESFPNSLVGVTPQGWLRSWDETGKVHPAPWDRAEEVAKRASAVILSVEDVDGDEDTIESLAASSQVLAVTEAAWGVRVYWRGDVRRFSVPKVGELDATGAGDIFAASFFVQLHKTRDPWEAARFANQLAAQSVTRPGLTSVPQKHEIKNAIIEVF